MMRLRLIRSTASNDNVGGVTTRMAPDEGGMSTVIDVVRPRTEKRN
jgi:hypothetical protein